MIANTLCNLLPKLICPYSFYKVLFILQNKEVRQDLRLYFFLEKFEEKCKKKKLEKNCRIIKLKRKNLKSINQIYILFHIQFTFFFLVLNNFKISKFLINFNYIFLPYPKKYHEKIIFFFISQYFLRAKAHKFIPRYKLDG